MFTKRTYIKSKDDMLGAEITLYPDGSILAIIETRGIDGFINRKYLCASPDTDWVDAVGSLAHHIREAKRGAVHKLECN